MLEYAEFAKSTIANMVAATNNVNNIRNRELLNRFIIDFNRNYIPWIEEIALLEDGKEVTTTSDRKAYPSILESLGYDDSNEEFHTKIIEFIRSTPGVLIGYNPHNCENCDASVESKSGYIAWDVERLFFDLTYQLLIELGLSLS